MTSITIVHTTSNQLEQVSEIFLTYVHATSETNIETNVGTNSETNAGLENSVANIETIVESKTVVESKTDTNVGTSVMCDVNFKT